MSPTDGIEGRRMRSHLSTALIMAILGASTVAAGVSSAPVAAAIAPQWGYAWADQPTAASIYTPDRKYQANSTGAKNRVTHFGIGSYRVKFTGLVAGSNAGTVDVTTNSFAGFCKVVDWTPTATDTIVDVQCFSGSGAPNDAAFNVAYANPGTRQPSNMAYVLADQPTTAEYTPPSQYQFNSKGGTNTVSRVSTGVYSVSLPKVGLDSGTVKVTGYTTDATNCQVGGWGGSPTLTVTVQCYDTAGNPADGAFTMTWVDRFSLLGEKGHTRGYVWADSPSTGSYTPSPAYQENSSGASNGVTRFSAGNYLVTMPSIGANHGDVQVTTYGSTVANCVSSGWGTTGTTQEVYVLCFDAAGALIDVQFTVQYVK